MTPFALIKSDLFRYTGKSNKKAFFRLFLNDTPGFKYTVYLRLVQAYGKFHPIGFISRFFYNHLSHKYGFQIPKQVGIGKGFLIMHFGHLVINSKAKIGDNCNIYHGVTIGATFKGTTKGVPVIGNEVWIGAGAVVVGGITIGDKVLIAPNAYVNFSVPSGSVVLGNPAKIIPKETAVEEYVYNIV